MRIRACEEDDHRAVDALLKAAFPSPAEAHLVAALRAAEADTIELVAEDGDEITGMILFSPVTGAPDDGGPDAYGLGLAPIAVRPDRQKSGIGAALMETGLDYARTLGAPFCIVLGEPVYYGRFGFMPASRAAWRWDSDPDGRAGDAFQIQSLRPGMLPKGPGEMRYHPAFETV